MEKQIYGLIQHNIKDVRLNITDHVFDHIDGLLMIISWYLEDEIKDIVCLGFDGDFKQTTEFSFWNTSQSCNM